MNFRSGFIGLIGPTNAGKSTLLNRLVGEALAIETPKPQTTRHQIRGIYTDSDCQMIFCDTPGLHQGDAPLNQEMRKVALDTMADMDFLLLMLDGTWPEWNHLDEVVKGARVPVFVLFNKADLLDERARASLLKIFETKERSPFFLPPRFVSALNGEGVVALREELKNRLSEGPLYYPKDDLTDRPLQFLAAEIVRKHCFLLLQEEIPYGLTVLLETFKEPAEPGRAVEIKVAIVVNREGHKGIVIGSKGSMLKKIGERARAELEKFLNQRVILKTFVRVEKHWIKDPKKIQKFVY